MIPDIMWDYYRLYTYKKQKQKRDHESDVSEVFNTIYKDNLWNSKESHSGSGSVIEQTRVIQQAIPEILKKYRVGSVLDVPCGDFNWMQRVDLSSVSYIGGDIVPDLILGNNNKYKSESIKFIVLDVIKDSIPKVDLIFCRDCLVHFSYEHIQKTVNNIKASGSQYLLTTSFINRRLNFDIETGYWRPINLQLPPFNFPAPLEVIIEKCTEGNGKSYDKALVLYRISDLK